MISDAQSHDCCTVAFITWEGNKEEVHLGFTGMPLVSFSPFVLSVDGHMAREAHSVVKRVASKLASMWGRSYGEVMGWVQSRLSFAILRATNRYMCVLQSEVEAWFWHGGWGRTGHDHALELDTCRCLFFIVYYRYCDLFLFLACTLVLLVFSFLFPFSWIYHYYY